MFLSLGMYFAIDKTEWGLLAFLARASTLFTMKSPEEKALEQLPREGFIKTGKIERPRLSGEQRMALIRKGNELFNNGDYEKAKRVFITAGYSDGLSRMGDYYYNKNLPFQALQMYIIAPAPDKKARLIERMALTIRYWLHGGEGKNDE
jgi:tetratricopeptide (TPR) repeat protein